MVAQYQTNRTKHREISFRHPHPDPHQALSAMWMLSGVDGVISVRTPNQNAHSILISYDITLISLQFIEELLHELGFHLDNNLLVKLKRALHYYTEDIEREALGCGKVADNNTRDVFIKRYQRRLHGCRDARPDYWRRYL